MAAGLWRSVPDAESAELSVRLLGGLQLRIGGVTVDVLRSGRARSLLAFLVLHPGVAHSRQSLAFAFWPDSPEAQARTNLRNVLHLLRRAHPVLDASIEVTARTLQWSPSVAATVDVDAFVVAADAAVAADPDDAGELIERCRAAAALYGGELLAGDTDEWLLAQREELGARYRDVLGRLATALIDQGSAEAAVGVARDLVRADPLDESAHRLRMEAHQAAGDRAGAVRAYHECVATLDRELGVEPAPPTVALYESLLAGPGGDAVPVQRRSRDRAGLVGREHDWRRLVAAWEAAGRAGPAAVVVTGEAGVGKTRLVDEFGAWCGRAGAAVAEARSYATEGDLGFAVVASWLRCPDVALGRSRLAPGELAELARLLPELGSPPPVDGADEAERRRRLLDAVVAALRASGRPTLLVADDAQWSDRASQELIHYLLRQRLGVPVLVVLTARREDIDAAHPLAALRDALAVLDCMTELALERLDHQATGELGQQLVGAPLDAAAIDALFAESGGNPLFVVESVRAGWNGTSGAPALSPKLRAVIDERFRRLSEEAADVVRSAAVVGRPCSARLLGVLSGLDDRLLARGLDELWQRRILDEVGTDSYDFSHGKLREAAYDGLTPATRRRLHGAVAEALTGMAEQDPEFSTSQVAIHFEAAHRFEEAVAWYQRAALEAQRASAYVEAVSLLDRALALVPALPAELRHARELELLSTLPVSLSAVEGYVSDRMSEAHRRAADVAGHLAVELEPALVRSMVMAALCSDEFGSAAQAAGRLLDHAVGTGDAGLRVESHYLLGISAFWAADLEAARRHFETVVSAFAPALRPGHLAIYGHDPQVVCLSRLANTLWFLGRDDEARASCADALELAEQVGHPLSEGTALVFASLLAVDLGDHDLLRRHVVRLGDVSPEGAPFRIKHAALAGLVDVMEGRPAEGIGRVQAALDRCGGRNLFPGFQAAILRLLLAACAAAGDTVTGLEACARMLALGGSPLWEPEAERLRAELFHLAGATADAVDAALSAAEATAQAQGAIGHLRRVEMTRRRLAPAVPAARR